MVMKFTQPDHTAKTPDATGAREWMGEIETALPVLSPPLGFFAPYASTPVSLTVNVSGGTLSNSLGIIADGGAGASASSVLAVAAQSFTFTAPTTAARIDRLAINALSGSLVVVTGTESATPSAPAYPDGVVPVCRVALGVGQAVITNAHITDERGFINTDGPNDTSTAFGTVLGYETFSTAGVYGFAKPAQATFYRITMVGGGGGPGGEWVTAGGDHYFGGTGGGGGCSPGLIMTAEDLTITVGNGGSGGAGAYAPDVVTTITKGQDGAATTVSGLISGTKTANPGIGGNPAARTPATGTGGAGGAATLGGFAGGSGLTGVVNNYSVRGGATGEQGQLSRGSDHTMGCGGNPTVDGSDGFVLIEWF